MAASILIAPMLELGHCSQNQAAALAGLAPFNVDRGKTRFTHLNKHLVGKGKPAKLALIAVARKILITANASLRDNTEFAT